MDKNWLYDVENKMYRELDAIKEGQKQYAAGVEKGIDMTIAAVMHIFANEEEQPNNGKM